MSGNRTNRTMLHYWLLLSWFGSASLQYINEGASSEALTITSPPMSNIYTRLPYLNYVNLPFQGEISEHNEAMENTDAYNQFYQRGEYAPVDRIRRTIDEGSKNWLPNILTNDKQNRADDKIATPTIKQDYSGTDNDTETETLSLRKRSFSPWGGKRSQGANLEQMWSWKRATRSREPSMPKRVRFSPWGGKRSGQVIYKAGNKINRVIYSTSIPALTRILSNYSPSESGIGYQFRPSIDKRHPVKILALSAHTDSDHIREAMPFKNFFTSLPSMFKIGHPYVDLNFKKDGKRKVVFSQWGGKRSPPIIGPIWSPAPNDIKDATLDAILLIRNNDISDPKEDVIESL